MKKYILIIPILLLSVAGWGQQLNNSLIHTGTNQVGGLGNFINVWNNEYQLNGQLLAKFMFIGNYSAITSGKLPNTLDTTTIAVSGTARSESYKLRNIAVNKSADSTDYIWFKSDGTQRTTTTAELIGYDFKRTFIKYDDSNPYYIRTIGILKKSQTLTHADSIAVYRYFRLPIYHSGLLFADGFVKGNRGVVKNYWTAESVYPAAIVDGNTKGWYIASDLTTVTKDGSNKVSVWADKLASGNDLAQATADKQPIWSSDGITFDGLNSGNVDFLKKTFTMSQPVTVYMVAKIISTNNNNNIIFTGGTGGMHLYRYEALAAGKYIMFGGTSEVSTGININLNAWEISISEYNGTSSNFRLGTNQGANKSIGTTAPGGFTLGARNDGVSGCNFIVKEIIIRNIIDGATDKTAIYDYLKNKYGL